MFPLLIPLGIGALGGALLDKKNPLRGAALGAGFGAAGGGILGATGALGAAGAAGATGAAGVAGTAGATTAAGAAAAPTGLLGTIGEYAKPLGQAASAGMAVQGLLNSPEHPIAAAAPMQQTGTGAQTLAQLAGQNQQSMDQQAALAEQERAKRRQMYRGGF